MQSYFLPSPSKDSTATKKVSKSIRPLFRTKVHNMSKKRHLCCFIGCQRGITDVHLTSARIPISCSYCPHLINQTPRRIWLSTNSRRLSPSHTKQNVSDRRSLEPETVPGRMPCLVGGFEIRRRPRIKAVDMQLGIMTATRGGRHGDHPKIV